MKMLLVCTLIAACGGGVNHDGFDAQSDAFTATFDEVLPSFITAVCSFEAQCNGSDRADCEADVTTDMADAKEMLDMLGEDQCARCMHARTKYANAVVAAGCSLSAVATTDVVAECDKTPNNGMDSADEACAGFP